MLNRSQWIERLIDLSNNKMLVRNRWSYFGDHCSITHLYRGTGKVGPYGFTVSSVIEEIASYGQFTKEELSKLMIINDEYANTIHFETKIRELFNVTS